ncbi:anti-sigma factor [Tabrizicola aquatica]|uniref:anti-sigma factor n=1 Tax=Tabrizicola aquatica TaxID=909926 RepID=UPI000CD015D5|nr:anti-sigma factor [Tabrizicola aquatica]
MTDLPPPDHEADDLLAAEYVLGVLDLPERAAAEARAKREPGFAARIADWEARLGGLNDGFDDAPAPDLLPRIEARLFPSPAPQPAPGWSPLRWLSGMAFGATLVLLALVTLGPPRLAPVALLATADNRLAYEVASVGDSLRVTRVAGVPAVEGQVHELWVIAPGAAPVSLGLLEDDPLIVTYPTPPAGWVLAVSVEPAGGSTTGQPTGPVILTAQVGT